MSQPAFFRIMRSEGAATVETEVVQREYINIFILVIDFEMGFSIFMTCHDLFQISVSFIH